MLEIGYYSLPVVGLTAVFAGMVLALQSYTGFARFSAEGAIANVVVLSITRELGPVLAGLMVAGRIGAAMAAEIGTMRVTEQIDALTTLSTNPIKYLIAPRLIAGVTMMPLLVFIADIIGVFGVPGSGLQTRFQSVQLPAEHWNFPGSLRRHFRSGEGLGLWFHRHPNGLLSWLPFEGGRAGCGRGDH